MAFVLLAGAALAGCGSPGKKLQDGGKPQDGAGDVSQGGQGGQAGQGGQTGQGGQGGHAGQGGHGTDASAPDAGATDTASADVPGAEGGRDGEAGDLAVVDAPADASAAGDATDAPSTPDAIPDASTPEVATDVGGGDASAEKTGGFDAGACVSTDGGPCLFNLPLFNSGVDDQGNALPGGSVDPHYTLLQSAEPTLPGPNAIVVSNIAEGYWLVNDARSKWLAPSPDQRYPGPPVPCNASGTYVYRTTFDLTGFDPATVTLRGGWAADNSGVAIRLNGTSLGLSAPSYSSLAPFTVQSGFARGLNTLDFEINDLGCPSGLRVELSGTAAREL